MELQSRVALVTGAGSGIGRASAITLAAQGAKVGLLGHTRKDLEDAATEITSQGGQAVVLEADVSDEAQMSSAVTRLIDAFDRLDIVVANAGINGVWGPHRHSPAR